MQLKVNVLNYSFPMGIFFVIGRLDLNKVPAETLYLGDPNTQYYVCGPEVFMRDVGKALQEKGVQYARIHAEVFGAGAVPI